MVQSASVGQLMVSSLQLLAPVQFTVQGWPAGQVMGEVQAVVSVQSMTLGAAVDCSGDWPHTRQEPAPSHIAGLSVHELSSAAPPGSTALQVPSPPQTPMSAARQDSHTPLQAASQHTP